MPDDDCGHPKPILADPPGATPEQIAENLAAYNRYLDCLIGKPKGDCKGKDECWRAYETRHGIIYPPAT